MGQLESIWVQVRLDWVNWVRLGLGRLVWVWVRLDWGQIGLTGPTGFRFGLDWTGLSLG